MIDAFARFEPADVEHVPAIARERRRPRLRRAKAFALDSVGHDLVAAGKMCGDRAPRCVGDCNARAQPAGETPERPRPRAVEPVTLLAVDVERADERRPRLQQNHPRHDRHQRFVHVHDVERPSHQAPDGGGCAWIDLDLRLTVGGDVVTECTARVAMPAGPGAGNPWSLSGSDWDPRPPNP